MVFLASDGAIGKEALPLPPNPWLRVRRIQPYPAYLVLAPGLRTGQGRTPQRWAQLS
jgi:hypothetical protein